MNLKVYKLYFYNIIMVTTIQISDEVWKELNKRKERGETMDDVLKNLIKGEIKNETTNRT